jgi:hypothetical protein
MDYTIFVKNKFLNTTIGDFAKDFDKTDYKGFENIVTENTVFGLGKIAVKVCRKNVKSVFESVDGLPVMQNDSSVVKKDGYVDKNEMFQLLKNSYLGVNGKEISEEEISKMTVRQAVDLVIEYWNKK